MDPKPKRQPVPAGGQPTPAVIDAADATPPAATSSATAPDAGDNQSDPAPTESPADAAATEQPVATEPSEDEDAVVEARVLVAFDEHDVNDVFVDAAAEVERLKLAGYVDPHPDAVAYAKSLDEGA